MMNKNTRNNVVPVALLTVVTLMLSGGCTPIGNGEFERFAREMLLSAAAAFLL